MAQAVEDSFAVIIAMSQKYKDSPNTRAGTPHFSSYASTFVKFKIGYYTLKSCKSFFYNSNPSKLK